MIQPSVTRFCSWCGTGNPSDTEICFHCGETLFLGGQTGPGSSPESLQHGLLHFAEMQLAADFSAEVATLLLERLRTRTQANRYRARLSLLAEEIAGLSTPAARQQVARAYQEMVDGLLLLSDRDALPFPLPEAILRYGNIAPGTVPVQKMVFDFLSFDHERETVYTDFVKMPQRALKNAARSFLHPAGDEILLLVCDMTLFGACTEGFAMTDQGLYWKMHFHPAASCRYDAIRAIGGGPGHLLLNGRYFHVTPALDLKMKKLLRRLRDLHRNKG